MLHIHARSLLSAAIVASGVLASAVASADPISFDFTGSEGGTMGKGAWGNTRTFWSGPGSTGVRLDVTAWGYTDDRGRGDDNALETARLGRWDSGLGVCNRDEKCTARQRQADNAGADDWVLFIFSEAIDITSVTIDPFRRADRDVSYYVGNTTAGLDLRGISYDGLSGLGFSPLYSSEGSVGTGARDVAIDGGPRYVNALLFGGFVGNGRRDYFNIRSLVGDTQPATPPPPTQSVPEPASLLFILTGAAMALPGMRRSRK